MKIILALLALGGAALAIGKIIIWGDNSVGYGSYVPWGLWVAAYGFLITMSAGSAFVANMYYAFGREGYKTSARPALLLSIISLVTALPIIGMDLGHPFRGIMVLLRPDFQAFLPWAVWSYVLFLIVSFLLLKKDQAGADTRLFGKLSLLLAALFVIFEALHFGTVIAHPVWNSALVIPLFFATAVALGFCVLALFGEGNREFVRTMLLAHLLIVDIMEIGKLIVEWYSSTPAMQASASEAVASPVFWVFLAFGVVLPILLLSQRKPSSSVVKIAATSTLVGLLAAKYEFVTGAFALAQFAELPSAYSGPGLTTHYIPTVLEIGVTIGFVAAGALIFLWSVQTTKQPQ
ncbi:prokaryotic molybdopterin-containing oxidoreductase family, membrane subunit [Desulfuromusa kysingii]|uniref:Prokaryotic molybdopterin-containing oxidoreductase family, membrane subunit n=1 Tax=Desulfuromusa kysingii TaxID=37625 RepID=A0A1H4DY60_9BACT|nr:NrfD/PsrC family molybdoenzyme membrane anchor subunit [Desulfuromusa kysingii]SEA77438.1 prokaryotic molybdopterin-containing oxidoreductase family, membrane subunit [Desulfuromusa kysingii]